MNIYDFILFEKRFISELEQDASSSSVEGKEETGVMSSSLFFLSAVQIIFIISHQVSHGSDDLNRVLFSVVDFNKM